MDGDYAGVAANVAELVVVWTREDFAAEATHQPHHRLVICSLVVVMVVVVQVG